MTPASRRSSLRTLLIEIAQMVMQAVLVFLIVTTLIGRFVIYQTSMEPNFHQGQRVVVSKLGNVWNDIFIGTAHAAGQTPTPTLHFGRGQIVVFYDNFTMSGDPLIKRVIGLPGEQIQITNGHVMVNGTQLNEPYLHGITTDCTNICGLQTLAADEYFVLGDNRSVSRDSREIGPIHASQFIGRVVLRYWPLDQLTLFL